VIILSRLVSIYRITGRIDLSCSTGKRALALLQQHKTGIGVKTFVEGYLKLRMTRSFYERNELDEARRYANEGLELAEQWGAYDSLSLGYFNSFLIHKADGDFKTGERYLKTFLEKYPYEDRFQYKLAQAYLAELAVNKGDQKSAESWAESSGLSVDDDIQYSQFKFYDVLAQILIEKQQYAEAKALLIKLLQIAAESQSVQYEIRIRARFGLLLQKEGDEKSALEMITPALNLAATGKFMRTILDLGECIAALIYTAGSNGVASAYCFQLVENFRHRRHAKSQGEDGVLEVLSFREQEVLSLIALGYSNQKIADELFLSLHTIKSHARSIYSKLGVKNRMEAVARARLMGIIPEI
jgi:LuxR family maltose regulon positive regulatory protein